MKLYCVKCRRIYDPPPDWDYYRGDRMPRCPICKNKLEGFQPFASHQASGQSRDEHTPPPPSSSGTAFDPYLVLEIERNAGWEDIKRAYRERIKEYHPDKVAHLGAELRALAERKAKEINRAYEYFEKQHSV